MAVVDKVADADVDVDVNADRRETEIDTKNVLAFLKYLWTTHEEAKIKTGQREIAESGC